jgi:hypothetical protein
VATVAGDDGVGVAGLDAVRRKTVLRRDETEPARARPCVGRSPAALSGVSTASLSIRVIGEGVNCRKKFFEHFFFTKGIFSILTRVSWNLGVRSANCRFGFRIVKRI